MKIRTLWPIMFIIMAIKPMTTEMTTTTTKTTNKTNKQQQQQKAVKATTTISFSFLNKSCNNKKRPQKKEAGVETTVPPTRKVEVNDLTWT